METLCTAEALEALSVAELKTVVKNVSMVPLRKLTATRACIPEKEQCGGM